jgi:MoxR-like ATPase
MPDISDEILDIIQGRTEKFEEAKAPKELPEVVHTLETGNKSESQTYRDVMFADLFWKPKHVPDHPVRLFSGYDHDEPSDTYVPPVAEFEQLSLSLSAGLKPLVVGPTGAGKTLMMEHFAASTGRPFVRIAHDQELDRARVFGKIDIVIDEDGNQITDFVPGVLPVSMSGPALVVMDEVSRAPGFATIQYQSILDRRTFLAPEAKPGKQIIKADPDWLIAATDNTKGNGDDMDIYSASNVQDASFINRLDIVIEQDYLPEDQERVLIDTLTDRLQSTEVHSLAKFSRLMHQGFKSGTLMTAFSPRNIVAIAQLVNIGVDLRKAIEMNYVSRVSKSEVSDVMESVDAVFGSK